MELQAFRTYMMERVRAFDRWAREDMTASPQDYRGYTCNDWLELFNQFMETHFD